MPQRFLLAAGWLLAFANASASEQTVTWTEFHHIASSADRIRLQLPDGVAVEGTPADITSTSLVLLIVRTSDKKAWPKGRTTIPRDSIRTVEVRQQRSRGRMIGLLAGAAPGVAILISAAAVEDDSGLYVAAGGGVALGVGAAAGYYIGRALDRRFHSYRLEQPGP